MLYPNGQRTLTSMARPISGALAQSGALAYGGIKGASLNRYVSDVQSKTAGIPDGYNVPALPVKPGGMAATPKAIAKITGSGSMLSASLMSGSGSIRFTTDDGTMGLVVSMSGSAVIVTLTAGAGVMSLTLGMAGAGGVANLSGAGNMSLVVPFAGTGTVVQLTGSGDMKGIASMSGGWTPYAELSPQNLARSVWDAVAAQYTDAGTMGAKLNTASSGGVDLDALAAAVWAYAQRSLAGAQATQLAEVWALHGLDPASPLAVTDASRTTGTVAQTLATAAGTTTVTRTA